MTEFRWRHKILTGISMKGYKPLTCDELSAKLGVARNDCELFKREIEDLHRSGRLLIGEDLTIRLAGPDGSVVGIFRKNPRGFGFVVPSDPAVTEDLFIAENETMNALTGDIVQASVSKRRFRGETRLYGKIVKILARGKNKFVGNLIKPSRFWMVQTDGKVLHQPILVDDVTAKGAKLGDRVVVQVTEYPEGQKSARGVILEVLGVSGEPDVEIRAVIEEYDLPREFPADVEKELEEVIDHFNRTAGSLLATGKLPEGRIDLRDKVIVTIDPATARDFDDAISLDVLKDGYELGVHIADVSEFVHQDSLLDNEARIRGNSVYLPRLVLPMIPEALSNGLCSLQEAQDRLTKSTFIKFDKKGRVKECRYANTVIRSTKRLTYEQATSVLEGKADNLPSPVIELLLNMDKLAKIIYKRRAAEGMLHLDLPEVELEYSDNGELVDAHPADTSFSHTIIEMFMVEANEAVARLLDSYNIPFLRRIHPEPAGPALEQLREFLNMLGHRVSKSPERTELQDLINSVKGKPESFAVSYAVLRSLQRAEYSPKNVGHFALASRHYCHFTSPIRRYADLHIHRLLDLHFAGKLKSLAPQLRQEISMLYELGEHITFTEGQAESAERQIKETLIIELLSEKIGEEFDGIVTGISSRGPFIQLPKYLIEGLIPLEELGDDWWEINQDRGFILGRHTNLCFRIGDPLKVAVVSADPVARRLNLSLVKGPEISGKTTSKGKEFVRKRKSRKNDKTDRSSSIGRKKTSKGKRKHRK